MITMNEKSSNTALEFQKFYDEIWSGLKDNPMCKTETARAFVIWLNCKSTQPNTAPATSQSVDVVRLLRSEKYRFALAYEMTENNVELANALGVTERTIYRLIKKYRP